MTLLSKSWRFLMTVRFGVALMIGLMVTMMFATQFEASTSTRAMKHFIYGSAWFDIGTYLFVVNLLVNTWRRRPFRFRHAGFLTVHAGVITIVAGGLMTRYLGIDGTMPIPEGQASGAIMLPESDLVVTTAQGTTKYTTHYDIAPWEQEHDDVFSVPGTPYALRIDRYYPTGAVTDTLLEGATGNGPMLQVALGNGQSQPTSGWLAARDPAQSSATIGGVRVRFVESPQLETLKSQWSKVRSGSPEAITATPGAGTLQLAWTDGGIESIQVPLVDGGAIPTKRPGYAIHIGQVFRSFAMTDSGLVEAPQGETNPAIRFHLVGPGDHHEEHYSFTAFPEFRMDPPEGKEHLLSHAQWAPNAKSFDAAAVGTPSNLSEIAFEWRDPGTLVTHTNWGDPSDGQPIGLGETRAFAGANVTLRVLQSAREGRISRTVQKVSEEVQNPVVHVLSLIHI